MKRWDYTRQMRADPRLLKVINHFASQIRPPSPGLHSPKTPGATAARPLRFPEATWLPYQHAMEQRVLSNPVLQEAIRVFGATITQIELVPPSTSSVEQEQKSNTPVPPRAYRETVPAQPTTEKPTLWDTPAPEECIRELEQQVHNLERQVRRRQLEKEALRLQVTKLGNKPCA